MYDCAGKQVVVKFFENNSKKSKKPNNLVTRTLGKVGFIDSSWKPTNEKRSPKSGEFWRCVIIREVCPGKNEGCFILQPIVVIDSSDILKLVPGMYTDELYDGLLVIRPKQQGKNCIITLNQRKKDYYAWLVEL